MEIQNEKKNKIKEEEEEVKFKNAETNGQIE